MSSRGLGGGGGSQTKRRERWLLGSLAGCGDADLRVNRAHEHFDLHVITGSEDVEAGWDMFTAGQKIEARARKKEQNAPAAQNTFGRRWMMFLQKRVEHVK